jgi:enoyl-CoA hydratase/carnithine racemase
MFISLRSACWDPLYPAARPPPCPGTPVPAAPAVRAVHPPKSPPTVEPCWPSPASRPTAVIADRHGEVVVLTLNHPERLNAWTRDMEARYFDLRMDADEDLGVLAMVVTGAGRSFCVSADMAIDDPARRRRSPRQTLAVRKPLVAAINGAAAGVGLLEALYCEMRFCARGAELSASVRSSPDRHGVRDARDAVAQRRSEPGSRPLALGRVMGSGEAAAIGLVDRIVGPDRLLAESMAGARDLVDGPLRPRRPSARRRWGRPHAGSTPDFRD